MAEIPENTMDEEFSEKIYSPGEEASEEHPDFAKRGRVLANLNALKPIPPLILNSLVLKEPRLMARAVRLTMAARKNLDKATLSVFLKDLALDPEVKSHLSNFLSITPGMPEIRGPLSSSSQEQDSPNQRLVIVPEMNVFAQLLIVMFLLDQKLVRMAKTFSVQFIDYIKMFNRRSLDLLSARMYFFYSLAHEKTDSLADIRSELLSLHRSATLRHDEPGQEMLLNLLLRNYLHFNLYDQAEKLRSKVKIPDSHSNQQYCRYLFYNGRIRAIQLEYTDSKECLMQAYRKAPLRARGFRIACTKWSVIVQLLLGEIPEKTVFDLEGMADALLPYYELTNAVRTGDLEQFHAVTNKHLPVFKKDCTHNLIVRLRHNVIRTGLRRINIAYSKISLSDVAAKLRLETATPVEDAELIVSKAISDGAIDAVIDHDGSYVSSKESGDIYSTGEPLSAFHSRIAFCLNIHNEAVKALRFPPDAHKKKHDNAETQKERWKKVEEIAMSMEDDGF